MGHPLADLAYSCMGYHLDAPQRPPLAALAADSGSGIPSEREFVAEYCALTGLSAELDLRFYLAFSLFRCVSIIQGVYKRGLSGNASSGGDAKGYRGRVEYAANTAWGLVQRPG